MALPSDGIIWMIIIILGIGTFLIRFSFLGLIGDRIMPNWLLRHLRYTAVAILPALVTPLVLWPSGGNGDTDPSRIAAVAVVLFIGIYWKNAVAAVFGGMGALYAL